MDEESVCEKCVASVTTCSCLSESIDIRDASRLRRTEEARSLSIDIEITC